MRYLIQLLIPALIFIVVVYLAIRGGRVRSSKAQTTAEGDSFDTGMFILILVIGAMVAVGVVFALQSFWTPGP
ncbi:MAG: hypothetical protein O7B25_02595 [Gammaproteobacteria bacterium]|nr:hypothetical protein [Gammaproteobacteria bacterium]